MKKTLLLAIVIMTASWTMAQDYKNALGIRGGSPSGLTFKHFLNGSNAIEGILGIHSGGFQLVGLYEIHANAFDVAKLNWYYGGGAHVGAFNGSRRYRGYYPTSGYVMIGADGIVGLEYTLTEIPINFSLDLKPTINLVSYTGFWIDGGLSIRYCF